jgi:NADPH:quinone reductase-like Zn-dependent oxidoreductase
VYGGPEVPEFAEVERPTPDEGEVPVRVVAASGGAGDWHLTRGTPFLIRLVYGGYRRPKFPTPGVDRAGRIEAVGRNVTAFQPGDEVIADLSEHGFGGFAEYVRVPATKLVSIRGGRWLGMNRSDNCGGTLRHATPVRRRGPRATMAPFETTTTPTQ